ncbi:MAG: DUF1549 domain-containing protein [Planctomycetota bacterium]|nr:DUF1549 domain-containing protein [Planctomycetota bacterium]
MNPLRFGLIRLAVVAVGTLSFSVCVAAPPAVTADTTVSFLNDVEPVLTRFGCSSGGCHGKLAGHNGFRLSLRGYAPEQDYQWLAREAQSRRVNLIDPAASLLLQKGAGTVPHGGGRRLLVDSPGYVVLFNWIRQGLPPIAAEERRPQRLEIQQTAVTLATGEERQLAVTAFYSDGTTRDVTWMSVFKSNDAGLVEVSAEGRITARRAGETAIVAAFDGLVASLVVTVPYPTEVLASAFAERRNFIDTHLFQKLEALRLEPSGPCDDATFLRRSTLDVIGTLPTAEEVRAFLADSRSDKRAIWIDQLLNRPEFADFWALQLADLFQNRRERDHDVRGVKGVRALHAWLRTQMAANRPWNDIARDVLLAQGDTSATPAVGYYVVTVGEQPAERSEVADSVAQAFLGTRIGCARCHNHPLERYTQDDYYHFIGFFSRIVLDRKEPKDGATRLQVGTQHTLNLSRQLQNEQRGLAKLISDNAPADQVEQKRKQVAGIEREIDQNLQSPPRVSQPRTGVALAPRSLDRQTIEIPPGGDPRQQLADWLTAGGREQFAGAMVNRIWRHYFAVGLVEPVDDLRGTNPPSNRPLWDALVAEFAGHNYDFKHLMRLMLNSRAYQLSSATTPANATDTRFYSHYYARRLSAEVLLDGIGQVTGIPESYPGYPFGTRAIQLPGPQVDSYFLSVFGRSDRVTACDCERNNDVTLPQLLHLRNSEALLQKIDDGAGRLAKFVAETPDDNALIDQLFLTALGRHPRAEELARVLTAFGPQANRKEAAADLFWALLNTKEFAFNH